MSENKLFTPDTLADGYEDALKVQFARNQITYEVTRRIMACREKLPQVYMRFCYIAKDNPSALMDTVRIFTECYENTPVLNDIRDTKLPRFYIKPVNVFGAKGFIYVDRKYIYVNSPIYETENEAQAAIEELELLS